MKNLFLFFLLISFTCSAQYDTAIAILQASIMSHDGTRAAAQQNYWLQDANGEVYQNVSFPETKNYRFDFTGHGSKSFSGVWTQLSIKVDDVVKTTLTIDNVNPDIWTAIINVSAGTHKVSLAFVNDNSGAYYKLYMCLLYIFPVNLSNSNDPVIYPAINKNHSLPTFGTGFLTSDDFNSGHLRGFVSSRQYPKPLPMTDVDAFAATGANLLRVYIQLQVNANDYTYLGQDTLTVDSILHRAWLEHFYVNIVLTEGPDNTDTWWGNENKKFSYVQRWKEIAARYKDSTEVACFSLCNEPDMVGHLGEFAAFAQRLALAIRSVDTNHVIIMPYGVGIDDVFRLTEPLPVNNVVYEVHYYQPFAITHQGVTSACGTCTVRVDYPNLTTSNFYDAPLGVYTKNNLSAGLQNFRNYSAKYNVPIYIGEFSCATWAPDNSSCNYVADAVDLFEQEKWSWTYFNFRKFQSWESEIPPNAWYQFSYVNAAPQVANIGAMDAYRTDTSCAMQTFRNYFALTQFTPSGVRVADTSCVESSGTVTVRVYLDSATSVPMSVDYYLINGSATFPKDFKQVKGTLNFSIGDVTKFIPIVISKDKISESTENFYLQIFNAVNADISDDKGEVQIINNP